MAAIAEGTWPKVNNSDTHYASEANNQFGGAQSVEAGENITGGNVVYIHKTNGKAYVSDTGMADDIRADGIAYNTANTGADVHIRIGGVYVTTGLTDKADYYLGVSGALSITLSGVRIGTALSTTELFVDIKQDDKDAIGSVKPYLQDFTGIPSNNLAAFWVLCNGQSLSDAESPLNGQTIPNLNGSGGTKRFLRGATTSDNGTGNTAGGTETHSHTITNASTRNNAGPINCATNGTAVTSGSTLPSYYEVVFIMKVK